ncbi:hypothetical protein HJG60_009492 [Phyllostomus discolor]|uniref:Uncharacterized protein n=1 Tax=Phyllostomus discolor TaxID=89673 RepID=A0A834DCJ4_9CHIR|nr:hypothetical protein HJG60_009492 [Phyllostomus discolor]
MFLHHHRKYPTKGLPSKAHGQAQGFVMEEGSWFGPDGCFPVPFPSPRTFDPNQVGVQRSTLPLSGFLMDHPKLLSRAFSPCTCPPSLCLFVKITLGIVFDVYFNIILRMFNRRSTSFPGNTN